MIGNKPVLAVIPVRGGSKGIPSKNLRRIGKHSLLERAIKIARNCACVDQIIVTTDDEEMHRIAGKNGVAAPTLRPAYLASDSARTADVIIDLAEQIKFSCGYILLLQATSPLRTLADLNNFLEKFENDEGAEAAVSLCHLRGAHPDKLLSLEQSRISSYRQTVSDRPRQEMVELYEPNGAFYIIDIDILRTGKTFLPAQTLGVVMPEERSANLDTMMDWDILEAMIAQGKWAIEEYE